MGGAIIRYVSDERSDVTANFIGVVTCYAKLVRTMSGSPYANKRKYDVTMMYIVTVT